SARGSTASPPGWHRGGRNRARRGAAERIAAWCVSFRIVDERRGAQSTSPAQKRRPRMPGAFSSVSWEKRSAGLDAAAVRVRPLVLVAEAAGADERRRAPGALVVGFVAAMVEPRVAESVGDGLTGIVTDE